MLVLEDKLNGRIIISGSASAKDCALKCQSLDAADAYDCVCVLVCDLLSVLLPGAVGFGQTY